MINKIMSLLKKPKKVLPNGYVKGFNVLDEYVHEYPCDQLAADLFKEEWSSNFPRGSGVSVSGRMPLFEDPRVEWASGVLGGFERKRVLELGPLEGAHAYMLEKGGASHVLSIEANKRAFMKCLIAKEINRLTRTKYMLGDFVKYLKATDEAFDVTFACGVLYHLLNPAEVIEHISRVSNSVFIWALYYDEAVVNEMPSVKKTMGDSKRINHQGFEHILHEHYYQDSLSVPSFCGGANPNSFWMTREGLLGCLKHFGFKNLSIEFDKPVPGGPGICVVGEK